MTFNSEHLVNPFKKGPGGEEQTGAILATSRPGDFPEGETFLSYHTAGWGAAQLCSQGPKHFADPSIGQPLPGIFMYVSIWKNAQESLILLSKKEVLLLLACSVTIALCKNCHQCLDLCCCLYHISKQQLCWQMPAALWPLLPSSGCMEPNRSGERGHLQHGWALSYEQPHWELLWEWKVYVRHCISLAPNPKGISSFAPLLSSFRSTLVESCIYLFECWAVFAVNRRDSYLGCSLPGRRVCIPTLSMLVLRKGLKF